MRHLQERDPRSGHGSAHIAALPAIVRSRRPLPGLIPLWAWSSARARELAPSARRRSWPTCFGRCGAGCAQGGRRTVPDAANDAARPATARTLRSPPACCLRAALRAYRGLSATRWRGTGRCRCCVQDAPEAHRRQFQTRRSRHDGRRFQAPASSVVDTAATSSGNPAEEQSTSRAFAGLAAKPAVPAPTGSF